LSTMIADPTEMASVFDISNETAPGDPLAAQIARALEEEIVLGRLRPGQKLREEELAERFAGSRHQVREALARLGRIGIVTKERNRGVSVRRFSAEEVRQIYEVREILQRQAALRIPLPVDEATLAALLKIHEDYEQGVEAGELQRIHASNDLFHMEMFRLCGNELLLNLVKHYMDLTYAIRAAGFSDPENLETSRRQHRIMIDLLRGRDSWAVAQICVDHIQPTMTRYLEVLRGEGDDP
jgi:DNA-binding GntR family transcriptional regulator